MIVILLYIIFIIKYIIIPCIHTPHVEQCKGLFLLFFNLNIYKLHILQYVMPFEFAGSCSTVIFGSIPSGIPGLAIAV